MDADRHEAARAGSPVGRAAFFPDRIDAGRRLGRLLEERLGDLVREDVVVLALPRGGVPVAAEVARALAVPLDVLLVRKLGLPDRPELAMGAIGEGGVVVRDDDIVRAAGVTDQQFEQVLADERIELERRRLRYRPDRKHLDLDGRTTVIVDDGVATGSTARAACRVARAAGASRVVLAAPVAPAGSTAELTDVADEVVVVATPSDFAGVGQFYGDFGQVSDGEVVGILDSERHRRER